MLAVLSLQSFSLVAGRERGQPYGLHSLTDCPIEEQRVEVRILSAEGVKAAEIHRRMLVQYGARTLNQF